MHTDRDKIICEVDFEGVQHYYLNSQRHNDDGPAIIYKSGVKFWYKHGMLHREDGPAVIYPSHSVEWWLNHKEITNWNDPDPMVQKLKKVYITYQVLNS